MSIEQSDTVDGMGIDKTSGEFVLMISDHLQWEHESAHFSRLESKLGGYLGFVKSGQYLETVPQARGMPVRIKLIHEHALTESAHRGLEAVKVQLEAMNVGFSYEALPENY